MLGSQSEAQEIILLIIITLLLANLAQVIMIQTNCGYVADEINCQLFHPCQGGSGGDNNSVAVCNTFLH